MKAPLSRLSLPFAGTTVVNGPGNRLLKIDQAAGVTTYSYNAANEQILIAPYAAAPNTITYDPNGNLLLENSGGQLTTFTWDVENRLSHVVYPNSSRDTSTYYSDGRRFQKNLASGLLRDTVWDGQNALQERFTTGGAADRFTYSSPGTWGTGADLISQRHAGTPNFYIGDGTNSARALVSAAQAITDTYLYKALGEELLVTGTTNNVLRAFGMFGYQRDEASRLWVNARNLDVGRGRWVSRDPGGVPKLSTCLYCYAFDGPVGMVDPSGNYGFAVTTAHALQKLSVRTDPETKKKPCNAKKFWDGCKKKFPHAGTLTCCQQDCDDNCPDPDGSGGLAACCEQACAGIAGETG